MTRTEVYKEVYQTEASMKFLDDDDCSGTLGDRKEVEGLWML